MRAKLIGFLFLCFFLVSCNDRKGLTPHEALLGHWIAEMGEEEYYFSKDEMVLVENGEVKPPIRYRVALNNYPTGLVIEMILDPATLESEKQQELAKFMKHEKVLAFEDDKRSVFVQTQLVVSGNRAPIGQTLWRYADNRQRP